MAAVIWALFIPACVAQRLLASGWQADDALLAATLPYAMGSLLALPAAVWLSTAVSADKQSTARFAVFFTTLTASTLLFTGLLFALNFQFGFSHWQQSPSWLVAIARTVTIGVSALYFFAVGGVRPLLPWGMVGMAVLAIGFSRGWFFRRR